MSQRCDGGQREPIPTSRQNQDSASLTNGKHREQFTTKLSNVLPRDLLGLAQWVCWKREQRNGKLTKVPYDAKTGRRAKTACAKPEHKDTHCTCAQQTWATFTQARDAYQHGGYDGLGFVFAGELVGVDLDDCRNPATGEIAAWARPLLEPFAGCYMEVSPSGTGVHIILLGTMPEGGNRTTYGGGMVEMYGTDRFFTVTGETLGEDPGDIVAQQDAIDALHAYLFPQATKQRGPRPEPRPVSLDDQTLLEKAMNPATSAGQDCAALWRGDISAYGNDDSRGDYHLARHLVWWTGGDVPRIERLMRSSSLAREKFDQKDGRYGTYLLRTIEKAILSVAGRYYSGLKGNAMPCQVDMADEDAPAQETTGATAQNECCAAKDKIIAQLQRELTKARKRIDELEHEKRWEKKARRNPEISATTKAVAKTAIELYQRAKPVEGKPNHLRKMWYPKIAEAAGVSERTVSAEMDKISAWGGGEKETVRDTNDQGKRVDRVLWAPSLMLLEHPDKLKPEKPRNHGGKRECPECGGKRLRIKSHHYLTCMNPQCGHKWETESAERTLRGDESEMVAASDAMLAEDAFMPCQVDSPESGADCSLDSVQIESLQTLQPETSAGSGLNHHDERAELLTLAEGLGWQTRIPVGIENVGGTGVRWREFTATADNTLIDQALRSLRIRAEAYEMAVS